jgi:hypothetical protein
VGGWRESTADDDDEEEQQWTRMNAHLALPAGSSALYGPQNGAAEVKRRNHMRSLTGGSQRHTWAGGQQVDWSMRMTASSGQSRTRTPSNGSKEDLGYFGQSHGGKKMSSIGLSGLKKRSSMGSMGNMGN